MTAAPPIPAPAPPAPFDALGGEAGIARLVDAFYDAMARREDAAGIFRLHDADDLARTRQVLARFLCEWTRGDRLAHIDRSAPALLRRHARFGIDAAAAQAWLACLEDALRQVGAPPAAAAELQRACARIARRIADAEPSSTAC